MMIHLPIGDTIEVGGTNRQKPQFVLNRWGSERSIALSLDTRENSLIEQQKEQFLWKGSDTLLRIYQKEAESVEVEIILLSKPASNRIRLNMETAGLDFHWQPPLTA